MVAHYLSIESLASQTFLAHFLSMPRKSRFAHPLKAIRLATGMTQAEMAQELGISRSLLQKIENCSERMPPHLPVKIRSMTGCDLERKTDPRGSEFRDVSPTRRLEPYDADSYKAFKSSERAYGSSPEGRRKVKELVEVVNSVVKLLFEAAAESGSVSSLLEDFEEFGQVALERYGLEPHIEEVLRTRYEKNSEESVNIPRAFDMAPTFAGELFINHFREKDVSDAPNGNEMEDP